MDPSVQDWNTFAQQDPDIQLDIDQNIGVGNGYRWVSKQLGDGSMKITEAALNDSVVHEIRLADQKDPMRSVFKVEGEGATSTVSLDWNNKIAFPFNILGPLISRNVKKTYTQGLKQLAEVAKSRYSEGTYGGYKVQQVSVPESYYVTTRNAIPADQANNYYTQSISALFRILQDSKINTSGSDCALIYNFHTKEGNIDMAAALPIGEEVSLPNSQTVVLRQGNALSVDFYGDRSQSAPAHKAVQDYMRDRGLNIELPVVEEYVTDALSEKDPSKWLTKIFYRHLEG